MKRELRVVALVLPLLLMPIALAACTQPSVHHNVCYQNTDTTNNDIGWNGVVKKFGGLFYTSTDGSCADHFGNATLVKATNVTDANTACAHYAGAGHVAALGSDLDSNGWHGLPDVWVCNDAIP